MSRREPPGRKGDAPGAEPPLESWRREHLGRLLLEALRIFEEDVLAGLEESGISGLRMSHLVVLRNTELAGSRLVDIARRAGLTKQAVGPLVQELAEAGVLSVEPDPVDGRARRVRFTAAGERGLRTARSVYGRLLERYAEAIGEARLRDLLEALAAFVAAGKDASPAVDSAADAPHTG